MSAITDVEWADRTWGPLLGCDKCSAGCAHCYAIRTAWRLMHNPNPRIAKAYEGLVYRTPGGDLNWTGRINLIPERLAEPLHWKKPQRIFVNSQSDLFHPDVPNDYITAVFGAMAACPQHTFQILTKRPERMPEWFKWVSNDAGGRHLPPALAEHAACQMQDFDQKSADLLFRAANDMTMEQRLGWPLPNVQLGISAENQDALDKRAGYLVSTPAAVHFVSGEPLLGGLDFTRLPAGSGYELNALTGQLRGTITRDIRFTGKVDWIIVGGESGPNARPMHPQWVTDILEQCRKAGTAFFFKQWGEWLPVSQMDEALVDSLYKPIPKGLPDDFTRICRVATDAIQLDGRLGGGYPAGAMQTFNVGKKAAGRLLNGRLYDEFPNGFLP